MFEYFKKKLPNNQKTKKYLSKCKTIYVVCCWAKPLILKVKWSGKFDKNNYPLVWLYDDFNGVCDDYYLRPVTSTTSGIIYNWYFDKDQAERRLVEEEIKLDLPHHLIKLVDEEIHSAEGYDRIFIDVELFGKRACISWFKEEHFQDEWYLNLEDCKYTKVEAVIPEAIYWRTVGYDCERDIYLSADERYVKFTFYDLDLGRFMTRIYDINELFKAAGETN